LYNSKRNRKTIYCKIETKTRKPQSRMKARKDPTPSVMVERWTLKSIEVKVNTFLISYNMQLAPIISLN